MARLIKGLMSGLVEGSARRSEGEDIRGLLHWRWGFEAFKKRLTPYVWSRFRGNAMLQAIRAHLPTVTEDLKTACRSVEPDFIRVGQGLQGIYGDTRNLTQQVLDSVALIGGNEGHGVLFHLRGLAEDSVIQLQRCQDHISEKTMALQSLLGHLADLSVACHVIGKEGLLLKVVAINIGIESAQSLRSSQLFSVVAEETGNLSDKIKKTIEEVLDVLNKAWAAQQSLNRNLQDGLQEINRLGKSARCIVEEAVQGIESLMKTTRRFVEQAGENSRKIYQQVGDLVIAVQFHDSMSQRVEHIVEAFVDVDRLLDSEAFENGSPDRGKRLAHALSIARIQFAQLKEIIAEIERVHQNALHSFQEILTGSRALVEDLSEIRSGSRQASGQEGAENDPIKRLGSSFGRLNSVLHRGQDLTDGVRQAAKRASETVEQISKYVREINTVGFETHLMALNAIVKAAHLGQEGGPIEVLAQEVKNSSIQSLSVLDQAAELLGHVTKAAERLQDRNDDTSSRLSFEDGMEEITRAYHRFTETTGAAHGRADEITVCIKKTKAQLDFLPLLAHRFTESLRRMDALIQDLTPFATETDGGGQADTGDVLKRYTMEKEREIHEISLYGAAAGAELRTVSHVGDAVVRQRTGDSQLEPAARDDTVNRVFNDPEWVQESGSDVELFIDTEPELAKESAGHVELFDAEPEQMEETMVRHAHLASEETKQEKEEFGDNVELF